MAKKKPKCPACGTSTSVAGPRESDGLYVCNKCGGLMDDDPDEGGTHSSYNPAARMEREERQQAFRSQQRKGGR